MPYTMIFICHIGIYWYIIFAGFRAARLDAQMEKDPEGTQPSSDPEGGVPIHALRMMSFFMHWMQRARKRLSKVYGGSGTTGTPWLFTDS